jgi:large subunit ribosomal protein L29
MSRIEVKNLSVEELNTELENTQNHLQLLKYNNAASTLANSAEIVITRRNIARIKTELRARVLAESNQKRDKIQNRRRLEKKSKR